jgi:hypothetical protein
LLYYRHDTYVILMSLSRWQSLLIHLGSKLMIGPHFFCFVLFLFFYIFSSWYTLLILLFISLFLFYSSYI